MPAQMMDGEALAAELRARVEADAAELEASGVVPGLATVLVGDDYASEAYERRVKRLAEELGCRYVSERLPADAEEAEALAIVGKLNADPRVSGILILRPLPRQVNEGHVYRTLHPLKDIEAVHPDNAGLLALGQPRFVPSTPSSVFWMLDRYVESTGPRPEDVLQRPRPRPRRALEQRRQTGALARPRAQRDRDQRATTTPRRRAGSSSTRARPTSSSSPRASRGSSRARW